MSNWISDADKERIKRNAPTVKREFRESGSEVVHQWEDDKEKAELEAQLQRQPQYTNATIAKIYNDIAKAEMEQPYNPFTSGTCAICSEPVYFLKDSTFEYPLSSKDFSGEDYHYHADNAEELRYTISGLIKMIKSVQVTAEKKIMKVYGVNAMGR